MKFGGHETFCIRPNWLAKGLLLLGEVDDVTWASNEASDSMGVGRNMSKSIGWWLNATGLSERPAANGGLRLSPLGNVIFEHDPYFSDLGTWWFLHLSLALANDDRVFSWFFQSYRTSRFKRAELIDALKAHLDASSEKIPVQKTLQRDVAVLLQSYARPIPAPYQDPEDNADCPFRRLGLLILQTELDQYDRRAPKASIPAHVLAAGLSLLAQTPSEARFDVDLDGEGDGRRLARCFNLDSDSFAKLVARSEQVLGSKRLATRFLAGSRVVSVRSRSIADWANLYFSDEAAKKKDRTLEAVL
ncbi:DUF4007 family protein [Vannielia litorea]|uniref:DUF4007 family protein n=1 Tax=Vannielia litorea TaxID=1217970 RepID=UPI001BD1899F|nr:DUF4007 family protein [Vannielia litorea]